jgi:hypothetical protein
MRSVVAGAALVLSLASTAALAQSPQRGPAPAQVRPFCSIPNAIFPPRRRGEPIVHGQNVMTMTNSGQPCRRNLSTYASDPREQTPVAAIELTQPPANGTVTIAAPQFAYLPRPGFIGTDHFVVLVPGIYDISWTVNVVTPDQVR